MFDKTLNKSEWENYFNELSKKTSMAALVEIEIQAMGTTDDKETEWVKLNGITYDPKDNELSVSCDTIDHIIFHPRDISISSDSPEGILNFEVNGENGYRHVIRFKAKR